MRLHTAIILGISMIMGLLHIERHGVKRLLENARTRGPGFSGMMRRQTMMYRILSTTWGLFIPPIHCDFGDGVVLVLPHYVLIKDTCASTIMKKSM